MNWLFMLLMILNLFAKSSAVPSGFPGYKPTASVTDFRNVRHNPALEQFLRNINNVNMSISTVQADHIAVKSFVHPINETLKETYDGMNEACYLINTFKDICDKTADSCQHVNEFIKVIKRSVKNYVHVLSNFERVCTMDEYPSSEIAINRCKRGDNWNTFGPMFESYSFLNEAIQRPGTMIHREERGIVTLIVEESVH